MLPLHRLAFALLTPALVALAGCWSVTVPAPATPRGVPKVVVLLVFDQFRGDFLDRYSAHFGEGGFKRLMADGAWFTDCHYPYAGTSTGPGHATLSTGALPPVAGIPSNEWYDPAKRKEVNCVVHPRYQQVPPPLSEKDRVKERTTGSVAPDFLKAQTFADALKEQAGKDAQVVALSLKDRSACLPGGKAADVCYWCDKDGRFVTSTFYRDAPHAFVSSFNKSGFSDKWLGKKWERLKDEKEYDALVGPDEFAGEGSGADQGKVFPHVLGLGKKRLKSNYYAALANSPFGNDVLVELAKRAFDDRKLGSRETPDFLSISFSSNDLVGHCWGPDSHEVMDTTIRTDRVVKDLLDFLDAKLGKDGYAVVISADHGICPLPEVARAKGKAARRVDVKQMRWAIEQHLDEEFPYEGEWANAVDLIEYSNYNMFYLNGEEIKRRKTTKEAVAAELVKYLPTVPAFGVRAAYTPAALEDKTKLDALGKMSRLSYVAGRSGDVMLEMQPYHFLATTLTGTTHGSPHEYDTHVPLVVMGPGVIAGKKAGRVSPALAPVLMARALGIKPPADAKEEVPDGVFAK